MCFNLVADDISFSDISDIDLQQHGGYGIKDGGYGIKDGCHGQGNRQKRMRTSFKHHQLRAMKAYFAINHNPDAKDLKELAQKTGLTKRVLQVWQFILKCIIFLLVSLPISAGNRLRGPVGAATLIHAGKSRLRRWRVAYTCRLMKRQNIAAPVWTVTDMRDNPKTITRNSVYIHN